MEIKALSIAGPFARLIAVGSKKIELRSWKTNYRGLVLLHSSSNKDYDSYFQILGIDPKLCPKYSIIGAAILADCIPYTSAKLWERDLERHLWMGDESYSVIRHEYYADKPPIGHVLESPIVFEHPITDVPGAFNYWTPKNERQKAGFERAIAQIR